MDSTKNGRSIIPFKKFGMVRVNIANFLYGLGSGTRWDIAKITEYIIELDSIIAWSFAG